MAALLAAAAFALAAPGDLDPTFEGDGARLIDYSLGDDVALDVQVRPDGRIVFVAFSAVPGASQPVGLLDPNGSLVETFADAGTAAPFDPPSLISQVAVQPDGKIVVVATVGATAEAAVARLMPDGSPDATFDGDGVKVLNLLTGAEGGASVALQPDGKIVIGGSWEFDPAAIDSVGTVVRLLPSGALDPGFGVQPRVVDFPGVAESFSRIAVQPDGRILAASSTATSIFSTKSVGVARLTTGGDPDATFGPEGRRSVDSLQRPLAGLEPLPDGGALVASGAGVVRLLPSGLVDPAFGVAGVAPAGGVRVSDTALAASGKLLLIGDDGNGADMRVARLQPGGALDTTFGSGGRVNIDLGGSETARAGALQADGRLLAAGRRDDAIAVVRLQGDPPGAALGPGGTGAGPAGAGARVPRCGGRAATIVGTGRRDVLRGTRKRDVIAALGGNDLVRALGGDDLVCGGPGADRLLGGPGADRLLGQSGGDRLLGQAGRDLLVGGAGADRLLGAGGRDRCLGGAGADRTACEVGSS